MLPLKKKFKTDRWIATAKKYGAHNKDLLESDVAQHATLDNNLRASDLQPLIANNAPILTIESLLVVRSPERISLPYSFLCVDHPSLPFAPSCDAAASWDPQPT